MMEYEKDRLQVLDPLTERWVVFDTKHGGVVKHKKTPGPYKNIRKDKIKKR